jgi:hypothetical protein
MRASFDMGFKIVIGLEGGDSDNPADPGGYTRFGIAQRYHPDIDVRNMTIDQAKKIYLTKYWIPAGCDAVPFPLDICLFDGAVNPQNHPGLPGAGNKELMSQRPENWQEFLLLRLARYMDCSKPVFVKGHIFRVLKLFRKIRG